MVISYIELTEVKLNPDGTPTYNQVAVKTDAIEAIRGTEVLVGGKWMVVVEGGKGVFEKVRKVVNDLNQQSVAPASDAIQSESPTAQ